MKIEEAINAVMEKHYDIKSNHHDPEYEPKIAIYMSYDYWRECASEISGSVSTSVFEFYENNTLMGYPIWRVPPMHGRDGDVNHVPFIVVNLDT